MVSEVRTNEVTIPAGTAKTSPQVTSISFPDRIVTWIELMFPPGPSGDVGAAFTMNGDAVIPLIAGTYIVADNETLHWDLSGYPDSGAWELTAYNTGNYDHTLYVRWGLDYLPLPAVPPIAPIPASALSGIVGAP